uniref:Uncharacterized protein n=1 Tax=Nelumbo nucifera TaxID=4432 RepID=A0A822YBA3_NELNU|nr:TPA_asm: hypothetical protein HUJ06_031185 [Nelumbo nucifera]
MAFHVACPITCRKICFCTLGFPQKLQSEKGRKDFLEEVFRVEDFLRDPWSLRAREKGTVQVVVPRIIVPTVAVTSVADGLGGGDGDGEEILSAQNKRAALQKRAVAASLAAEDYARRFETGNLADASKENAWNLDGENQNSSNTKVMCRLCFQGENEGSERATKMLPCKICNKKYHRNCLKSWAQHRDLFHWSSWTCPSCRICEVCRRTGDPNKFMFCKRCDGAYHCYCQQPPHKNVSAGPYLCPKHTRCHSCRSNVSGSGLSTRWFLGYTFCDACGRLFVKGNYCPICLKVYRDSELTPMVCCDDCQKWVHLQCDGISDEKYLQFQTDKNLYYKCAACRGDCYKVGKKPEEAIPELWRRRDEADREEIAGLRAAVGLPTQEEIFSISPFSDDEESGPVILKNEYGRSLRFSVKGLVDKASKNTKEHGKKYSNQKYVKKKGYHLLKTEGHQSFDTQHDAQSLENSMDEERDDQIRSYRNEGSDASLSPAGIIVDDKERCSINQPGNVKHNFIEDTMVNNKDRASRVIQISSGKPHGMEEDMGKYASKSETKGKKLVIHLGARNRTVTGSPRSEASSCHKEQDVTSNGNEETSQQKANGKKYMIDGQDGVARFVDGRGEKLGTTNLKGLRGREGSLIKLGKFKSDVSDTDLNISRGNSRDGYQSSSLEKTHVLLCKNDTEGNSAMAEPVAEATTLRDDDAFLRKHSKGTLNKHGEICNNSTLTPSISDSLTKDPKPLLKLKFKNPYLDNRSSWVPQGEEEKSFIKGQRSKRKRPSPSTEKALVREDGKEFRQENPINEVMDANWILKKLGKDAIGKRVEVHQPSDNSWHKGVVTDVTESTSSLTVHLDDGRARTLDLGKQGVRFVSQKQKRSRT